MVLAAELQLCRGNVAIAAMTLLDITERQDVSAPARREAERTMSVLAGLAPAGDVDEQSSEAAAAPDQESSGLLLPASSVAAEAPVSEEDGLSEFDKVVMRAFGMLEESGLTEEAKSAEGAGSVVDLASMQRQSGEEDEKTDEEEATEVPDVVIEEEIDDTSLTEEEKRIDARVEEATRELTDDNEEAGGSGGGGNTAPVLGAVSGVAFNDTSSDDSFTNATGALSATDADSGDTLTYSISGGSASNGLAGYDLARTGTYGTLYLNSSNGNYAYVPSDSAIERLSANASENFTLSVTDGSGTASQTLTASISGANDTPVFNAISAVSLTDTMANDSFIKSSGTFSASERDSGQTITFSATGQQVVPGDPNFTHGVQGTYGSLLFNANTGAYEYEPTDLLVNALRTDATDSFTLTASDSALSASRTFTVNITGADDGPSTLSMLQLSNAGGQQNVGATGLRLGVVTDPEGDTVTDITSTVNALPAWLSFGNQVLGGGSVEYFWEVGADEAPWRSGTKAMSLKARSSGIDSAATSFSITFVCQSDHWNDFLQSTDTETSPNVDDPTNIGSIRSGIKLGPDDFILLTVAERDALFDTSSTANGVFRVIYSGAETGSGSPAGSWNFDQTVNVDYKSRTIQVNGTVTASNIGYFDGASDTFTYTNDIAYSDTVLGTDSVFGKAVSTTGNGSYSLQNSGSTTVHIQLNDQVGFMKDTVNVGTKAALINTSITPLSSNPGGYKDTTNQMIEQRWRLLEPQ